MAVRIRLSEQAANELAKLGTDAARVKKLLGSLAVEPRPANLDIKALRGRSPWSRARVGPYRVIFRPLSADEVSDLGEPGARAYLIARIVHRRDLERIIRGL